MTIKENISLIEAGKQRIKKIEEIKKSLPKEPKITFSVKNFLLMTKLSLTKAIKLGYVTINPRTCKYVVTSKGNKKKQRVKSKG